MLPAFFLILIHWLAAFLRAVQQILSPPCLPPRTHSARSSVSSSSRSEAVLGQAPAHRVLDKGPEALGPGKRRILDTPSPAQSPTELLPRSPAPFAAAAAQQCSGAHRSWRGTEKPPDGPGAQDSVLVATTRSGTAEVPGSPRLNIWTTPPPRPPARPGRGLSDLAARGAPIPPQVHAAGQEGSIMEALSTAGLQQK